MSAYRNYLHEKHKERLKRLKRAAISQPAEIVEPIVEAPPPPPPPSPPAPDEMLWVPDPVPPMQLRCSTMRKYIAKHFDVNDADLCSKCREAQFVYPRKLYCYLARKIIGASTTRIGKSLGDRDHTTVLYSIRCITELLEQGDEKTLAYVAKLTEEFEQWGR